MYVKYKQQRTVQFRAPLIIEWQGIYLTNVNHFKLPWRRQTQKLAC